MVLFDLDVIVEPDPPFGMDPRLARKRFENWRINFLESWRRMRPY
ncbi:hypothetical protein GCM10010987_79730 [Bradyrhizobium guangdongense]|uniref:Uncharacterized protein n=1 Tax=Bradyrhizobium guangdongense TaxID=1325090 RepID=A0AA87WES3_9BRAD|nr:hypothetical protein GCM10010987_79730 [Bradyrhizobium guangdongense]